MLIECCTLSLVLFQKKKNLILFRSDDVRPENEFESNVSPPGLNHGKIEGLLSLYHW